MSDRPITDAAPERKPDALARILATTIIAAVATLVATKLFGRKGGVLALLLTTAGHELLDAPLAKRLSDLGL